MEAFSRRRLYLAAIGSVAVLFVVAAAAATYGVPLASYSGAGDGVYAEFDAIEAEHVYQEQFFDVRTGERDCALVRMTMEDVVVRDASFHRELPHPQKEDDEEFSYEIEGEAEFGSLQMLVTEFRVGEMEYDTEATIGEEGPGFLGFSGSGEFRDIKTVIYDFNVEEFDDRLEPTEFQPDEEDVANVSC